MLIFNENGVVTSSIRYIKKTKLMLFVHKISKLNCNNSNMSIEKLYQDIFEHIDYIDQNIHNPFLEKDKGTNPFAKFYSGTYVWIEPSETK